MNVLALCAGVGGLELGIRIAEPRARGVAYIEREVYAASILVARMEDGWLHPAPVWSDLGTFDARPWRGVVDCVASGDPCQPNSVAGRGLGDADDRWLIDQVLRIIDECRPARVFRENVPGNADGQLAALVPGLEGLGYRCAVGIFSAASAGASHRRERLFIMADRTGLLGGAIERSEPDGTGECVDDAARHDGRLHEGQRPEGSGAPVTGGAIEAVGHLARIGRREGRPEQELRGGRDASAGADGALADTGSNRSPAGLSGQDEREGGLAREPDDGGAEALPIFAPGPADARWPHICEVAPHLEPAVCRVDARLAHRVDRLRACGNGVTSLAAAYAWRSLDALLAEERAKRTDEHVVRAAE